MAFLLFSFLTSDNWPVIRIIAKTVILDTILQEICQNKRILRLSKLFYFRFLIIPMKKNDWSYIKRRKMKFPNNLADIVIYLRLFEPVAARVGHMLLYKRLWYALP